MSSLWKHPNSPYFMACFTTYVGHSIKQLKKSTGTRIRKTAQRLADELEEAGRGLRSTQEIKKYLETIQDLRVRQAATKAFEDVLRKCTGQGLGSRTTRSVVQNWLDRTRGEVSSASRHKYEYTAALFLKSIGSRADQDISILKREDIVRFRDREAKRVSVSTANLELKIVKIIFAAAESDGSVDRNEAKHVKPLKKRDDGAARRAFTLAELRVILENCSQEWSSLVLFGFYTGARLGDLALLTWQNLDLQYRQIRYTSRKTGRTVSLPLAQALIDHLGRQPAGDDPKAPVHPRAFNIVNREGRVGTLSRQFGEILAGAGLVKPRTHAAGELKKGRAGRREVAEISFHALRHTAVSLLKNAGVSDAVARDLVGHDSEAVNRIYTHIEDKTKREAVDKLPTIE